MSLYDAIGMTLEPWTEAGSARAGFAVTEAVRNPNGGVHGGAIASLVDTTGAHAVRSVLGDPRAPMVSVELSISFVRPIRGTRVDAEGRAIKVGRRLAFAEVDVLDGDGTLAAKGRVTFALPHAPATDAGA